MYTRLGQEQNQTHANPARDRETPDRQSYSEMQLENGSTNMRARRPALRRLRQVENSRGAIAGSDVRAKRRAPVSRQSRVLLHWRVRVRGSRGWHRQSTRPIPQSLTTTKATVHTSRATERRLCRRAP